MDMQLRAKKLAIETAVVLCEAGMDTGLLEQRYGNSKAEGGPSVAMIENGMRELLVELRDRTKPV